jgi:hypothetical protein
MTEQETFYEFINYKMLIPSDKPHILYSTPDLNKQDRPELSSVLPRNFFGFLFFIAEVQK